MIINNLTKTITDLYTAGAIGSEDIDNHIEALAKLKSKKPKASAVKERKAKKTDFTNYYNEPNIKKQLFK